MKLALAMLAAAALWGQEYSISGTVLQTGNPLKGVTVRLFRSGNSGGDAKYVTGEDGRFVFERLQAGKWNLTAEKRGYAPQRYGARDPYSPGVAIVTGPRLRTEDLVFRVRAPGMIQGQIKDEMGEPVVSANILLHRRTISAGRASAVEVRRATSNGEGEFAFGSLYPGDYYLSVTALPWTERLETGALSTEGGEVFPPYFFPGVTDPKVAETIRVLEGQLVRADMVMRTCRPAALSVKRAGDGLVRYDVRREGVLGTDVPVEAPRGLRTDKRLIAPGRIWLVAYGESDLPEKFSLIDLPPGGTEYELPQVLGSGIEVHIVAKGVSPGELKGSILRVRNLDWVYTRNAEVASVSPALRASIPAGRYRIGLSAYRNPSLRLESLMADGAEVREGSFEVADGGQARITLTVTTESGAIAGHVLEGSRPHAGTNLALLPLGNVKDSMARMDFVTDSDGSFEFRALAPGEYGLVVSPDESEMTPEAFERAHIGRAVRVQVAAGERVEVKLAPAGSGEKR